MLLYRSLILAFSLFASIDSRFQSPFQWEINKMASEALDNTIAPDSSSND